MSASIAFPRGAAQARPSRAVGCPNDDGFVKSMKSGKTWKLDDDCPTALFHE